MAAESADVHEVQRELTDECIAFIERIQGVLDKHGLRTPHLLTHFRSVSESLKRGLDAPERKAKRAKVPRDPLKPKRPMTSFFLFIKDKRLEIAKDHPKQPREVLKILAERWKHMSAEEKRPYEEEHERNMRAYKKAEAARALDAAADVKPRGDKPQAKPAAEEEDDDDDDEEEDVAGKANAGGGESDSESATSSSGSSSSGSTTDY